MSDEPEAAGDPPPGDEAAAAPSGAEADGNENPPVVPSGSEQENPPSNSDELGLQPSENDLILQAAGEEVHETEEEEEEHGGEDEMLGKGEMAPEYPPSQLARAPYWRMWWSRSHSYADEEAEAETFTVSRADMMTYLNTQLWFNEAAYGIPFTIALWAIFLILLGLHGEIESNYQVQSAVGGALVSVVGYPELGNTPAASIGTAVTGDNQLQSTSAAPTTCHCACVPRADFSEPEACQVDALNRNYLDIKSVVDGRFFPEYSEGELRNQMYKQKTDNMAFQDPVPFREIKDQSTLWFWIQHGAFPFLWQEADFAELALAREAIATSTTTTTTPELVVADDDGNSTETITTTLGSNAGIVAPLSIAGRPGRLYVTNQLIGGVRLRQKRMKMTSDCDVDPGLQSFYNAECRTSDAETGNWRNVQHPCFRPNSDLDGVFDCPFDVGRKLDSPNGPLETIEYRLIPFEWLDGATEEVELQAAFFNAEVRLYSYVRLTFTFESGGFMEKTHKVSAISANMYPTFWYIVPDLIFLSMISQLLYQEGMEVINAKREGLLKFYLSDFWNLVDWFSILAGFLISFLWFNIVLRTESVGDLVAALGPTPETVDEGYRKKWMTIIDDLESLGSSQDVQFMFLYWYTLVLMLRFFKNFQGQPRLSQISSTLLKSIMDMGHFLIVFSVVFVNFAIGGNLMFGTSSEDWSTIMGAINTSMMALLGNLDMDQLMEVSPLTAYLWFWSFMVVNWYLLLNLLVAIVFDHYYSFRDTVGETQGLGSQIVDVFHEKTWATDWYLQRKQYLKKGIIPKPDYKVFRFFDPAKFGYLFLDEQMSYEDVYDALVEESPEGVLYGRPTILEQKTEKRNADRAAFEESLKEENTKREEIRAGIRSRAGSKEGPGGAHLRSHSKGTNSRDGSRPGSRTGGMERKEGAHTKYLVVGRGQASSSSGGAWSSSAASSARSRRRENDSRRRIVGERLNFVASSSSCSPTDEEDDLRVQSNSYAAGGALDLIPLPSSVVVPDHEGGRKIRGGKAAKACSPGDALGGPYDSPFKEGRHRADDDDSPSPGGRADESPSPGGVVGESSPGIESGASSPGGEEGSPGSAEKSEGGSPGPPGDTAGGTASQPVPAPGELGDVAAHDEEEEEEDEDEKDAKRKQEFLRNSKRGTLDVKRAQQIYIREQIGVADLEELGVEPRFARHLMLRCRKHVLDETGYEEKRKQELTSLSIESNKMLETVVQDCETLQKQMTVIIDGVTKSCADLEGAIDDTHMVLANLQVERGVLACQGTALTATTYKDILWNKGQLVSTVPGLKQVADKKMKAALSIMGGGGFRGSPFGGGGGSPFATLTGGASSGGAGGTAGKFKALLAPNSG
eukprot:CAMPEP_0178995020 /NCGR_PEP_ID=MMETSP0795-20121207/7610_1 /TAXON_ID=88552 /ORGANISM="Amoebophrya sp., Strain Ameob2" /LENGTH=1362 /DNA_ID=CAMNT_0020687311 /DNA_START=175 /DNA_END=4263 /DNA_ORIENTATION=-